MYSTKKRARADSESDRFRTDNLLFGKRARAATEASADSGKWFNDSASESPSRARHPSQFDSDDDDDDDDDDGGHDDNDDDDMLSESGSQHDISMESGDDDVSVVYSHSYQDAISPLKGPGNPRVKMTRVPTPMVPMRPGASPDRLKTGFKQHVRRRHPQEYSASSDLLEVPSPIDEDEVPTPPSAAEAAGSQFSMLSVSDVDMEESDSIPRIAISPARPSHTHMSSASDLESAVDMEPSYSSSDHLIVRKQRQRSDALSSGNPLIRAGPSTSNGGKRGFSMGFRADCEKCRMRVPGHMNHFLG